MIKSLVILLITVLSSTVYLQAGVLGDEALSSDDLTLVPAAGPTLIVKDSVYSVDETVRRFVAILKKKGLTHFATINHQSNAKSVALTMKKAVVIIFGNPKVGTVLMNSDIRMALALPLKVAVYEDRGKVKLVYRNPVTYATDFLVEGSPMIKKITKALHNLSNTATR